MWLARPIYEVLPYFYMLLGALLLGAAWFVSAERLPSVFMGIGSLSLLAGIVLWLRRKDYRASQAEYNSKSLDD
jgi:NADH:ubiquinone oxidoreductase subunit 2 (subunit N)